MQILLKYKEYKELMAIIKKLETKMKLLEAERNALKIELNHYKNYRNTSL